MPLLLGQRGKAIFSVPVALIHSKQCNTGTTGQQKAPNVGTAPPYDCEKVNHDCDAIAGCYSFSHESILFVMRCFILKSSR